MTSTNANAMTSLPAGSASSTSGLTLFDKQIQKWVELDNKIKKIKI